MSSATGRTDDLAFSVSTELNVVVFVVVMVLFVIAVVVVKVLGWL
jgi:hypothetical protein